MTSDQRRVDTGLLLRSLGKALGFSCRCTGIAPKQVSWAISKSRRLNFQIKKTDIHITTTWRDGSVAEWGILSRTDLERCLWLWCQNHAEAGAELRKYLVPGDKNFPKGSEGISSQKIQPPAADWPLKVVSNRKICAQHYLLEVKIPNASELDFIPGQFFHVLCDPEAETNRVLPLALRRPFSIHRVEYKGSLRSALADVSDIPEEIRGAILRHPTKIQFLYRVVGKGTAQLSRARRGAILPAIGPLGNGFCIGKERTAVIVAGGIGVAPLTALAEQLRYAGREVLIYLGAVRKEMLALAVSHLEIETDENNSRWDQDLYEVIRAEFREMGARVMSVCTDDGSIGAKGLVTEMFAQGIRDGCVPLTDVCVYACGPHAMMQAVAEIAERHQLECQVSLEERMACGMGACYACTCNVIGENGAIRKKRVCREGPVFSARDVQWKD